MGLMCAHKNPEPTSKQLGQLLVDKITDALLADAFTNVSDEYQWMVAHKEAGKIEDNDPDQTARVNDFETPTI